jgi:hypothetical protein
VLAVAPTLAASEVPSVTREAPRPHASPRLKLSYRRFAIANLDGSSVWLDGAQLDAYALSRRWVRIGFELEGGTGHASFNANGASLSYGLFGLSAGVQYPARVTPFLEGRIAAGVLGGELDRALSSSGVTLVPAGASVVTYLWGGGLETGVEVYTVGRAYLSASIGWVRTSWSGPDYAALAQNGRGVRTQALTGDSFTFKLGVGI